MTDIEIENKIKALEEKTDNLMPKEFMKHNHSGGDYARIKIVDLNGIITGTSSFSTATSSTLTDDRISADDSAFVQALEAPAGRWYIEVSSGSLKVISGASETAKYRYIIYKI